MSDRTLLEIIESARDGDMPTHEECWLAMLAMDSLRHFDHRALQRLAHEPTRSLGAEWESNESFRRTKTALQSPPRRWLGNHIPGHPEQVRMRRIAKAVLRKVEGAE